MNYTRFNNFVADYETKLDEESNSTNDERLQKSLAENANEYVKRSEIGSGLLSGAEATYHGREYIKKAKGTYDTLKKLPQTIEDKLNKFKGDVEGGVKDAKQVVSDAKQVASQAKDAVQGLPKNVSEAKQTLESAVQSAKQTVQGKIQDVKDALNTGVQDAQDTVQQGLVSTRRVAPDVLGRDPENLLSGSRRSPDDPNFTSRNADTLEPTGRSQANPGEVQEQEMQEIKPQQFSVEATDTDGDALPQPDTDWRNWDVSNLESVQEKEYNDIYDGDIQPQQRKFPLPNDNSPPPGETTNLNQEITTAGKETEAAGKKAEGVAGKLQKGAKLASEEEEIGEGAGELEEETGGVLSDVILPIAAASMVGYAIYDLFDNKPKESIIAPKNPLVVPPKFTQQKEALATTSSLPQ